MSQDSYDAVGRAAVAIHEAIKAYAEVRYDNYRQRLVSPRNAAKVTAGDIEMLLRHAPESAQNHLYTIHREELR